MFKKLFLFIIIICVSYILLIFNMPVLADKIGESLGIESFNESILNIKAYLDEKATDAPSTDEIKDSYNSTLSGVIDFKDDVISGVEDVKEGVDTVRSTLSGAVDTYNDVKETITEAKDTIDSTVDTIKTTTETIKDTADTINNIGTNLNTTLSGTLSD